MAGKSDYLENRVLDHFLGGVASTAPATVYVGLLTTAPNDASTSGSLSPGVEVTGGSYARVAVTNNATNWPAASGGAKANGTAITFPAPSANWGVVVAFIIADVASGAGNILYWGLVTPNKTVNNGDPAPSFAIGDLDVTED
jgi:hypothetical protein